MADKIMRAEAQISAKDAGFTATLSKMGAALKGFGRTAKAMDGLPANLGASAKGMAAAGKQARSLGAGITELQAASAAGIASKLAAVAAPGAVAYGAGKVVMAGQKAQHERLRMEASGMASNEIDEANTQAVELARKIPNFDQTTIMHMLRNARTIVGSYEEAGKLMEPLLKLRALAQAARPGEDVGEDFDKLLKGFEIKGVTQNPKEFRDYMEGMAKAINVFGDTLKPVDYYEMFKLGRQSTTGLSQKYMMSVAPTLAQELGGPGAGVAQQAFFRAIVGGKMDKGALSAMQEYGLVDPTKIVKKKGGDMASVKPGGIMGSELAAVNPYEWVNQILLPALKKKGVVDPAKIQEVIASLFSKATAAQMVGIYATQQARIEKDAAMGRGAKGFEAVDEFNSRDGGMAFNNLKTQADSAMQEIGRTLANSLAGPANDAAKALAGWTARLHEDDQSRKDHPDEVTPGQQRFNALADNFVAAVKGQISDINDWAREKVYQLALAPIYADIKFLKEQQAQAQENLRQHPDSPGKKARLDEINTSIDAKADQARAIIDMHEAVDALAKDVAAAGERIKEFSEYTFNKPKEQVPGTVPGGPAAFPLSKGFGNIDPATGVPRAPVAAAAHEEKPLDLKAILNGKVEAKLDGRVPVDVTGKVQLEGSANVAVRVSVEGPGKVTGLQSSSKGNIKASVGTSMPDAGAAK